MGQLIIPRKPLVKDRYGRLFGDHIKPAKTVPNFGVEIEMGLRLDSSSSNDWGFHQGAMDEIKRRIEGYYECHEDCGAMEIVSVPFNFNEIRLYLKTLLETPIVGQTKPKPDAHGMHVHYGAKFMAGSHLERVLRFMLNQGDFNRTFMSYIAGRSTQTNCWATLPSFERFISRAVYVRMNEDWKKKRSDRFAAGIAINTYHDTHEFRIFATTNSADRACTNVEFVAALADLFRDRDSVEYQTDTRKFISLVKANADIYPHLARFISVRY